MDIGCSGIIAYYLMKGEYPPTPQPTEVDLTSLFTWTAGSFTQKGNLFTNGILRRSNEIDISAYAGKTMKVTWIAYKSSTGGQSSGYGLFLYDSNGNILHSARVPLAENVEDGVGYSIDDYELAIPSNAVMFKTTDFRTTMTFPHSTFSCKIVL